MSRNRRTRCRGGRGCCVCHDPAALARPARLDGVERLEMTQTAEEVRLRYWEYQEDWL